jgi:hypothetical protein
VAPDEAYEADETDDADQPGDPGSRPARAMTVPVRVDEMAVAAMALSDGLQAATRSLPESPGARRFRRKLDEAARTFREVAGDLENTAGDLVRVAAVAEQTCAVTWGVCPEHGVTLMAGGEVPTCRIVGCHRPQTGVSTPCTQPVEYRVVDAAGPALLTCTGHAIACRTLLVGAVITLASDSIELL